MKKKVAITILIIALISSVVLFGKSTCSVNKEVNIDIYQMGDKVRLNNLKIYVTSTRRIELNSNNIDNGEELFLVKCNVENTSNKVQKLSSLLNFKVRDEYGNEYEKVGFIEDNGDMCSAIKPGQMISGEYVVKVNSNLENLQFIVTDKRSNNESVIKLC